MADVFDDDERDDDALATTDAAALSLALNAAAHDKNVAARAAKFLDEQTKLVRLQSADLEREDAIRHRSLHIRHINELMKMVFGIGAALFATGVVLAFAALVWNAREATGLEIQPLKAPPDFAARGLDGGVLAQQLLDKLNAFTKDADKFSFRSADSISGNWGDDSKVEIPETGISVFELSRFLRHWLGRETSMSGEVYRTPTGIALTVRVGAEVGTTFRGREQDIDGLLAQAAQQLLADTQPYRYVWLLYDDGRPATAVAPIARRFVATASTTEKPWLQSALEEQLDFSGDWSDAIPISYSTARLAPGNPMGPLDVTASEWPLGHLERAYAAAMSAQRLLSGVTPADFAPGAVPLLLANTKSFAADLTGAYGDAVAADIAESNSALFDLDISVPGTLANDYARDHDTQAARAILARVHLTGDDILLTPEFVTTTGPDLPNFYLLADRGEWAAAADALEHTDQVTLRRNNVNAVRHTLIWPWLAYAWAQTGRLKDAEALIAMTPLDCTLCLEMRGRIAEARGDASTAARWYARTIANAPSLPFGDFDWGNMKLRAHDIAGAIAEYQIANKKSPHFADPLEIWGEVLMQQNRSDLALAKFEEANKYAPNWGRLHLKWGEALLYAGQKNEAQKQFATASRLDLSTDDKAQLDRALHG